MVRSALITLATALTLLVAARAFAGASSPPPLRTVAKVDLSRYLGKWYEIARLPNRFQTGCTGSSALYTLRQDGAIEVVNSCRNDKDGSLRQVKGRAWTVDPASNARLKVSFFWPFRGDYWIIELGEQYEYAVVAAPDLKYLWILSRSATMSDQLYTELLSRVERHGFEVRKIIKEKPGDQGSGES